jgi:hypothetical protein
MARKPCPIFSPLCVPGVIIWRLLGRMSALCSKDLSSLRENQVSDMFEQHLCFVISNSVKAQASLCIWGHLQY